MKQARIVNNIFINICSGKKCFCTHNSPIMVKKKGGVFLSICYFVITMQKYKNVLISCPQSSDWQAAAFQEWIIIKYSNIFFTNNIPIHICDIKSEEYYSYLYLQNMSFAINITSSNKFFATLSLFVIKEGLRHYDNYTCELDSVCIDNVSK